MPISVRQFLRRLKRCELGPSARDLLRDVEISDFSDADALAEHLVSAGRITAWQAKRVLADDLDAFRLERFTLQEPLGRGASGFVFRAIDETGRNRVLKILNPAIAGDPNALERFRREVRATMSLRHPNVVTATETGSARGLHFIAFEYHAGSDLKRHLAGGGLAPSVTASIIRQVADGLQHIADAGMVHRDVKPSNIHVAPDGTARLLDLGLARLQQASSEQTVTQTGQILGTVDYISPEQAQDSRLVDVRSDIYSLGCSMYECLSGRVPYPDGAVAEKLVKHLTATPEALPKSVPDELGGIVAKAMSRDPADRYQQSRELVAALEPFCDAAASADFPVVEPSGGVAVPFGLASTIPLTAHDSLDLELPFVDPPRGSRRWLALAVGVAAIALMVVGFLMSQPKAGSASILMGAEYPADAVLSVDGIPITAGNVPLDSGPHRLRVEVAGYEPYEKQFKVLAGVETKLEPRLTPTPDFARAARLAQLSVLVGERDAAIAGSGEVREASQLVRDFVRQAPAHETSLNAVSLLSRLSTHLDQFQHDGIADLDRKAAQWGDPLFAEPDELVAVFNSDRQHEAYAVNCVQFLPDGRLVSGSESGSITIWKDGKVQRCERMISHGVQRMALAAGGNLFLVGDYGEVRFCEGPDFRKSSFLDSIEDKGTTSFSPPYHRTRQVTAAAADDGKSVVTSADGLLFLWGGGWEVPRSARAAIAGERDMLFRQVPRLCDDGSEVAAAQFTDARDDRYADSGLRRALYDDV